MNCGGAALMNRRKAIDLYTYELRREAPSIHLLINCGRTAYEPP